MFGRKKAKIVSSECAKQNEEINSKVFNDHISQDLFENVSIQIAIFQFRNIVQIGSDMSYRYEVSSEINRLENDNYWVLTIDKRCRVAFRMLQALIKFYCLRLINSALHSALSLSVEQSNRIQI